MNNARFWVRYNGDFVKLTLRPGGSAQLYKSRGTDEGFISIEENYFYNSDLEIEWSNSTVQHDCDGYHTSGFEQIVRVADLPTKAQRDTLPAVDDDELIIAIPNWEMTKHIHRDRFAESAGY